MTPEQIVNVEVDGDVWYDDHLPWIDVHITFTSGDILSISACWVNIELIAAFMYANDSQKAKEVVCEYLSDR